MLQCLRLKRHAYYRTEHSCVSDGEGLGGEPTIPNDPGETVCEVTNTSLEAYTEQAREQPREYELTCGEAQTIRILHNLLDPQITKTEHERLQHQQSEPRPYILEPP
eukprot:CAMPEP_0118640520 /NCGR_PEP_ID=MMETSP0785-20121206/4798_1 /TAXON_ID=91992 /ORGANISM="Bolidomonas pacifica, Strain CCMP 1866" /LENGTH=106 /DNA_ID=CAMNT_0006531915 /DNA_START=213 /DNA_END=530 /DNA_ORIENTATION=+